LRKNAKNDKTLWIDRRIRFFSRREETKVK